MTPPVLRQYQDELTDKLRAALRVSRRVCLQAPTGSGKGVLIANWIHRAAARSRSVWLTCHRDELVTQLSNGLWAAGVSHGIIAAGRAETRDAVQVASIPTLVRRLGRLPAPDLLVVDEAHHASAASWARVIAHCGRSRIVGLTATPCRLDGRGLDDMFDDLVVGPTVADLIALGYLSPFDIYRPPGEDVDIAGVHRRGGDLARGELEAVMNQAKITGDAVEHYLRLVHPGNCLVYCVTRKHAAEVEAAYRSAGVDARYVCGDTPKRERDKYVTGFPRNAPRVIVSVDLFGEGLDVPGLRAVQLLRHTESLSLYLQQVGRALRVEEGKDRAIILDHVANWRRHDTPDAPQEWTLAGTRGRKKAEEAAPALRGCPECFLVFRAILGACPQCGWAPEVGARDEPEVVAGSLEKLDPADVARERAWRRQEVGITATAEGLVGVVRLAIERGYAFGWAARYWLTRGRKDDGTKYTLRECYRLEDVARAALKEEGAGAA